MFGGTACVDEAVDQPGERVVDQDADDDICPTKRCGAQREADTGTNTRDDQQDHPSESPDRDGYPPPPTEHETYEQHRRNHVLQLSRTRRMSAAARGACRSGRG